MTLAAEELAAVSVQQNDDMRKITGWVAIVVVPTAVTGYFGRNVPYPGLRRNLRLPRLRPDHAGHRGQSSISCSNARNGLSHYPWKPAANRPLRPRPLRPPPPRA
jgi:hypothetical protein